MWLLGSKRGKHDTLPKPNWRWHRFCDPKRPSRSSSLRSLPYDHYPTILPPHDPYPTLLTPHSFTWAPRSLPPHDLYPTIFTPQSFTWAPHSFTTGQPSGMTIFTPRSLHHDRFLRGSGGSNLEAFRPSATHLPTIVTGGHQRLRPPKRSLPPRSLPTPFHSFNTNPPSFEVLGPGKPTSSPCVFKVFVRSSRHSILDLAAGSWLGRLLTPAVEIQSLGVLGIINHGSRMSSSLLDWQDV
jgi:hypothetical protein